MVINPHYIPLRDINGIDCPSCFTGEETDQGKGWSAATPLSDISCFPPGSKLHHERGTWSLLLVAAPKPSDCLSGLARPAIPQPCPPLSLGGLLLSPTSTPLSILSTFKLVLTTQVPAPISPSCLNSHAKPYPLHSPPAHLLAFIPVFVFVLNSKHCYLKHLFWLPVPLVCPYPLT